MKICLHRLQIHNFRSIKFLNICLDPTINLFIGKNNSGKSNILNAINIGLSQRYGCNEEDFFHSSEHEYSLDDEAYIDVQFMPLNEEGKITKSFDSFWSGVFMQFLKLDTNGQQSANIRTVLKYDKQKQQYVSEKKAIDMWNDDGNIASPRIESVNPDMYDFIQSYYQSALRNFSQEIKDKKSYFIKAAESEKIPPEKIAEIESDLTGINDKIISYSPSIESVQNSMQDIKRTLGAQSNIRIESIPRMFKDLHRGMSVTVSDDGESYFDVENCGTGVNSWVSFLSMSAYVSQRKKLLEDMRPHSSSLFVSCLEEPEAFLHPQAQKQLLEMIKDFDGQLFISTHSQNIVSQICIDNIYYIYKTDFQTKNVPISNIDNINPDEKQTIARTILKTKGELLFGNYVVLCEGVSDQEMIEVFFEKFFGHNTDYYGLNVVPVGGKNYAPFLRLFKALNIEYYVLSDGEKDAVSTLKKMSKDILEDDYENLVGLRFFVHDHGDDLEKSLIREGYSNEIIKATSIVTGDGDYVNNCIKKNPVIRTRTKSTNKQCDKCGMLITEQESVPLIDGFNEKQDDLYHVITRKGGKVLFASEIARQITLSNERAQVPHIFKAMFEEIRKKIS